MLLAHAFPCLGNRSQPPRSAYDEDKAESIILWSSNSKSAGGSGTRDVDDADIVEDDGNQT